MDSISPLERRTVKLIFEKMKDNTNNDLYFKYKLKLTEENKFFKDEDEEIIYLRDFLIFEAMSKFFN